MATQMQEAQMQPNQMQDVQAQPMQMQGGQMQPNQMQFAQMQPMQMQGGQMQPNQMQFAQMQPMQMLGGQMQFIQLQPVVSVGSDSLGIMQAGFIEVFRYGTPFKQASERVCAVIDPLLQVAELIPVIGDYIGYAAYCLDLPLMGDLAKDFCCTQGNNTYKVTIGGQLPAEADTKKSLSNLTRFLSAREDTGCCIGALCPATRSWDLRFMDENDRLQFTVKNGCDAALRMSSLSLTIMMSSLDTLAILIFAVRTAANVVVVVDAVRAVIAAIARNASPSS